MEMFVFQTPACKAAKDLSFGHQTSRLVYEDTSVSFVPPYIALHDLTVVMFL
jgi:hypothetical protein